ncbi:MAG: FHA domain-containing protein [Chloroflexi bacterium]|nr:FHA domain-containing protein [Chloroflexota bacterium]
MPKFYKKVFLALFGLIFIFSPVLSASAQQPSWAIRVSMVSTLEKTDEMTLKVYFSVYDPKTDIPVLDIGAKNSSLALPQSNFNAPTSITKPDVPIYIVMVLDASGSMGGAAEDLKKAAKLALNNTPDNSVFSVVQFNEDIKLIQDFTKNIPAVSYAIDQYQVANKGTCLYDAAYSSVEALQKAPPGRRALILFTDGKDENASGKVCSKHTFMELSDFAQKAQIPINTIGLSFKEGAINEVELKGIAASTGGYSAIGKRADMNLAFQNIMDGLKAQWMVETSIYPKKGSNQAVLTLNLKDDQTLATTFSVESLTDYPGPPSPVSARLAGLEFRPQNLTYDIQLSTTSPELVDYVKVEVWDMKGGSKVSEYQFKDIKQNNTFNIPTEKLVVGRDYQLRMTAINKTDQARFAWSTNPDGKKATELIHPFIFDPTASLPSLEIQSVSQQNNDLILAVKTTNSQLIGGFDGWLVDEQTNTQVPNSNFTSAAITSAAGNVTIPLSKSKVPDGKYTAIVRVLGKDSQVYSTAQYQGIVYSARLPDLMQLLYAALIAAPIVIFVIIAILIGLVGFLMYSSSREKSMTGTPVLQGRIGGKLAGAKNSSGAVIPIATDEPIPLRGSKPAVIPSRPVSTPPDQGVSVRQPQRSAPTPPAPAPFAQPVQNATQISRDIQVPDQGATIISSAPILPRAFLTVISAGNTPAPQGQILMAQFPFVIGRTEGALIIPDLNVSRRHAQIIFDGPTRAFFISDLNSSNGTRLDNQRLVPDQPVQLRSGSLIALGINVMIRFELA